MGAEQKPTKPVKPEVERITQAQDKAELEEIGLPASLSQLTPGARRLLERGGTITGHIDEGSGDIVIDELT